MNITTPGEHFNSLVEPQKMSNKNIVLVALGIICLVLVGYLFWGQKIALAPTEDTEKNQTTGENNNVDNSNQIVISNQIPGEVALVTEVVMAESGWVAIHDNNNNQPGNILGAYYLPTGSYQGQIIPLLRAMVDGNSYMVVIHQDNGDKVFDYKIDTPTIDQNGLMKTANFEVMALSSRGE